MDPRGGLGTELVRGLFPGPVRGTLGMKPSISWMLGGLSKQAILGLILACYLGLYGILSGLTKSTDHPSLSLSCRN